jgi:hypothetical protein
MTSMIRKTEVFEDLQGMVRAAKAVDSHFDRHGVLNVTSRPGSADPLHEYISWLPDDVRESEFQVINEEFQGTAVESLLRKLPFQFGRTRLIKMPPKSCLSIHWDTSLRWHYAIVTNPACYLIHMQGDQGTFHHIPADGYLYEMDARMTHTAINASKEPRIHLVISDAHDEGLKEGSPPGHEMKHALV